MLVQKNMCTITQIKHTHTHTQSNLGNIHCHSKGWLRGEFLSHSHKNNPVQSQTNDSRSLPLPCFLAGICQYMDHSMATLVEYRPKDVDNVVFHVILLPRSASVSGVSGHTNYKTKHFYLKFKTTLSTWPNVFKIKKYSVQSYLCVKSWSSVTVFPGPAHSCWLIFLSRTKHRISDFDLHPVGFVSLCIIARVILHGCTQQLDKWNMASCQKTLWQEEVLTVIVCVVRL